MGSQRADRTERLSHKYRYRYQTLSCSPSCHMGTQSSLQPSNTVLGAKSPIPSTNHHSDILFDGAYYVTSVSLNDKITKVVRHMSCTEIQRGRETQAIRTQVPKAVMETRAGGITETRRQDNSMDRAGLRAFWDKVMYKLNLSMKKVCKTHIGREKL